MLVFDEKKYAEEIISSKKYATIKTQGRERCILVRYLTSIGYDEEKIKNVLYQIPMSGGEYLNDIEKDAIYTKIINKANSYDLITNINVNIYEDELNIICSLDNDDAKKLLFAYLVYYKWACQVDYLKFYSKKNNIMMVVENNNDLWKLADLSKLRVAERYRLCNLLFNKGLYKIDNFKSHNYIYLPFVKNEGCTKITINSYENILGELQLYEYPDEYKRCALCNTVIKKTRSPKKYCAKCAKQEKRKYDKRRRMG